MGDSNNGQASTSQANDLKTVTTSLQALTEQVGRLQTFMNYLMSDSEEQDTQPSSPIPSTSGITPPQNTTLESSVSEPVIIAGGSGATDNGESESEKETTSLFRELLDKYDTKEKCGPALDTDLAELINTMMTHQQSPESIKTMHNKWLRPENTPHLVTPTVNKDIWDVLPQDFHHRDIKFQKIQSQVVKGITPLLNLVDSEEDGEKRGTMMEAITLLSNACMELNILRRQEMKGGMKKWKGLVNKSVPITHQLFGNDTEGEIKKLEQEEKLKQSASEGTTASNMPRRHHPYGRAQFFRKKAQAFLGQRWQGSKPDSQWRPPYQNSQSKPRQPFRSPTNRRGRK